MKYEMGVGELYSLEPAYVRGLAYLKLGQGDQAAVEFRKLLDHPGVSVINMTGSLARLQLARAEVLADDRIQAIKDIRTS